MRSTTWPGFSCRAPCDSTCGGSSDPDGLGQLPATRPPHVSNSVEPPLPPPRDGRHASASWRPPSAGARPRSGRSRSWSCQPGWPTSTVGGGTAVGIELGRDRRASLVPLVLGVHRGRRIANLPAPPQRRDLTGVDDTTPQHRLHEHIPVLEHGKALINRSPRA